MSVSLAQFVGCEGSSFQTSTNPRVGAILVYEFWGGAKPLFVGWGWGLLSGAMWKISSSVLFCSVPTWLEVRGCCEGVLLLSKKIKLLIIISFVPLAHDPFFVGAG